MLVSKETFHHLNRIILICIIIVAVAIPFITSFSLRSVSFANPVMVIFDDAVGSEVSDISNKKFLTRNIWLTYLVGLYIVGAIICILRNIAGVIHIYRIIRKGKQRIYANNTRLIIHKDNTIAPFSWINYILISESDLTEAGDTILMHEQAHINHYHTFDLWLAELCIIFQWYNPLAWLIHRELQVIHEYEADEEVIEQGIEVKKYQLLLIKKAVGSRRYSMANSFSHSNLKKRITMMLKKKSKSWARLKYAYILPLTAIAITVMARPGISEPFEEISNVKVNDFTVIFEPVNAGVVNNKVLHPKETAGIVGIKKENPGELPVAEAHPEVKLYVSPDTTVFQVVDEMPQFPGGEEAFLEYIARNIQYPELMQNKGIQGRVVVSFTIMKDGTLQDFKIGRSLSPEADAEAIRVLKSMPKWIPGKQKGKEVNVKYTVPISYSLQKK